MGVLRDPVVHWAHRALENWAAEYCGGIGTELRRVDPVPTPDARFAAQIERELLVMRVRRPGAYRLVMVLYRDGCDIEQACKRLAMHERTFRRRRTEAYRWLYLRVHPRRRAVA